MGAMRIFLADRWSGGTLAALTVVLVLAQLVFSAWHCANRVSVADGSFLVICHGSDGSIVSERGADPDDLLHGCPGGILCGSLLLAAVPAVDLGAAHDRLADLRAHPWPDDAAPEPPRLSGAPPYPTGPPALEA